MEPRQVSAVKLRYFGGSSVEETAGVLGTSPRSVKRDWRTARERLHRAVSDGRSHDRGRTAETR
jgi:DNA-directed RNA polymerase specialized sigma24 family protein